MHLCSQTQIDDVQLDSISTNYIEDDFFQQYQAPVDGRLQKSIFLFSIWEELE